MFWGNLLGKNTPAGQVIAYLSHEFVEVERFVKAVQEKQERLNNKQPLSQEVEIDVATNPDVTESTSRVTLGASDISSDETAQKTSSAVNKAKTEELLLESKQHNNAQSVHASTSDEKKESEITFVSAEIERQLDNVNEQGKIRSEEERAEAVKVNWILARKAFYQRNYDLSEKKYLNIISNTDDNFDAYGELGNVYFNQGKKELAAAAYFEAATIFVRKGKIDRANSMIGLLNLLNKGKAQELEKLISAYSS